MREVEGGILNDELIDAISDQTRGERAHLSTSDALGKLERAEGVRSVMLFEHGTLQIKMYAPRSPNGELVDPQTPHSRDELYVVAQGSGIFFNGQTRRSCGLGDVLFAPAGSEHRFEDFSSDFAVWVMFYGPEGGEPRT
jgi:mannose-6-phosphate isomerase-like protein (cupin superfamily)